MGIYDAIKDGSPVLPSIDPSSDIAPLVDDNANDVNVIHNDCTSLAESFVKDDFDNDESACLEWEDEYEVNFERNVFPFIIDDEKTCTTRLLLIFYGFRFSRLVVIVIKTLMPCE